MQRQKNQRAFNEMQNKYSEFKKSVGQSSPAQINKHRPNQYFTDEECVKETECMGYTIERRDDIRAVYLTYSFTKQY